MWALHRTEALSVLYNQKVRAVLGRYLDIFQNKKWAKFLIAKKVHAEYEKSDNSEKIKSLNETIMEKYFQLETEIDCGKISIETLENQEKSYLDLKADLAGRIIQNCTLCMRVCRVNRLNRELGWCKAGSQFSFSSMFVHVGEEPELVPSGTIFTISCNMRCRHCQNWTISQSNEVGEIYTPEMMARVVQRLSDLGCRNINMVGGEPTPWLHRWIETFRYVNVNIPTVWNSNSYYSEESAKLLAGFIDVYLLDFKYGNNDCAERISSAPNYWEACTRNQLFAKKYGEIIIRVLVLPKHNECCTKPILEWVAKNLGTDIRLNLMDQYRPEWKAFEVPELNRCLTHSEFNEAVHIAKSAGLTNFIT